MWRLQLQISRGVSSSEVFSSEVEGQGGRSRKSSGSHDSTTVRIVFSNDSTMILEEGVYTNMGVSALSCPFSEFQSKCAATGLRAAPRRQPPHHSRRVRDLTKYPTASFRNTESDVER